MNVITPRNNGSRWMAFASSIGVAIAFCALASPAQACSDLPNVCAAKMQRNQGVGDIAATPPEQNKNRGDDGVDPGTKFDPIASAMLGIYMVNEKSTGSAVELKSMMKYPKFKAWYNRYQNGGWDYFQDTNNPKPGEYCSALYSKGDAMVRISGPGSGYDGALLTFSGPDITGSPKVEMIKVTLNQNNGSSQSVKAFNYQHPGETYASIALAVPTIEAGLADMKDKWGFDLLVEDKLVLKLEWHDGLAARKKLEECLRKRKAS